MYFFNLSDIIDVESKTIEYKKINLYLIKINLLPEFLNALSKIKQKLDRLDIIVEKEFIIKGILQNTIVGNKLDKKQHLTTLIDLGTTEDGKKQYLQKNLTSKKKLKLTDKEQIDLNIKYEYYTHKKGTQTSYETPFLLKNSEDISLPTITDTFFDEDDIRALIENGLYPHIAVFNLLKYSVKDDFYIDSTNFEDPKYIIIKNLIILEVLSKNMIKNKVVINDAIVQAYNFSKKLNNEFTLIELEAIDHFYIMNKLDKTKNIYIAEIKNNIKRIKIKDVSELNAEDYTSLHQNQKFLIKTLSEIIEKKS